MRLEVGGLRKLLVAAVEGADVGPVAGVDPHVRAQVKVQREAFPAAFEGTLEEEEEEEEESASTEHETCYVQLSSPQRMHATLAQC